jgi:hypothetical protein
MVKGAPKARQTAALVLMELIPADTFVCGKQWGFRHERP